VEPQDLQPASYRGVPFFVESTSTSGGRKTATKVFVNSDLQVVEDLGKRQRDFTVSGIVAARRNNSGEVVRTYQEVRDALLVALEKGGPGILVHPFYGRLENVVVLNFSLTEDTSKLGDSPLEVHFAISNADGLPQPTESVLGSVVSGSEALSAAAGAAIAGNFSVTQKFTGNFSAAVEKVSDFADAVRRAATTTAADEAELDAFNRLLGSFDGSAVSLASDPTSLGSSTVGLVASLSGLYSSKRDTFATLARLFSFGDGDVGIPTTTAGRIERKRNRDTYNGATQAMALAGAYEAAAQIDFATTDDVDATSAALEDQYQKLSASGNLDNPTREELDRLRVAANAFFDAQRVLEPRIVTVRVDQTSSRLLAYRYYGSSELGDEIARLNSLRDSAIVEGEVKVLSA
jgi:prophage DNA circulation protein